MPVSKEEVSKDEMKWAGSLLKICRKILPMLGDLNVRDAVVTLTYTAHLIIGEMLGEEAQEAFGKHMYAAWLEVREFQLQKDLRHLRNSRVLLEDSGNRKPN